MANISVDLQEVELQGFYLLSRKALSISATAHRTVSKSKLYGEE
jgi:hypothetical protein